MDASSKLGVEDAELLRMVGSMMVGERGPSRWYAEDAALIKFLEYIQRNKIEALKHFDLKMVKEHILKLEGMVIDYHVSKQ